MDTIRIVSAKGISLNDLRGMLAPHWKIEESADGGLVIHGRSSRAYFHMEPSSNSGGPDELLVDYSDTELVKDVIVAIGDDTELIVDNDFGTVLPGDQFVARIKADKAWDWRREHRRRG